MAKVVRHVPRFDSLEPQTLYTSSRGRGMLPFLSGPPIASKPNASVRSMEPYLVSNSVKAIARPAPGNMIRDMSVREPPPYLPVLGLLISKPLSKLRISIDVRSILNDHACRRGGQPLTTHTTAFLFALDLCSV